MNLVSKTKHIKEKSIAYIRKIRCLIFRISIVERCFSWQIPSNKLDLAREFFAKGKARPDSSLHHSISRTRTNRQRETNVPGSVAVHILANSDSNSSAHNGSDLYNPVQWTRRSTHATPISTNNFHLTARQRQLLRPSSSWTRWDAKTTIVIILIQITIITVIQFKFYFNAIFVNFLFKSFLIIEIRFEFKRSRLKSEVWVLF